MQKRLSFLILIIGCIACGTLAETPTTTHYDGWDTGLALDYSATLPLRRIRVDNDGLFSYFSNRPWEATRNDYAPQSGDKAIVMLTDRLFVFPPITPVTPMDAVQRGLDDSRGLSLSGAEIESIVIELDEISIGDNTFAQILVHETQASGTIAVLYTVGTVGLRFVLIQAYAPVGEGEELIPLVHDLIASMLPVDYSQWQILNPGIASLSAAYPYDWYVHKSGDQYDFSPHETAQWQQAAGIIVTRVDGQQSVTQTVTALTDSYVTTNAQIVEPPVLLPYRSDIVMAVLRQDEQAILVAATDMYVTQGASAEWVVAWDDLETSRVLFEQVLRGLRANLVPTLFEPDLTYEYPVDETLLDQEWFWVSAEDPDSNNINPLAADDQSSITFTRDNAADSGFYLQGVTGCGSLVGSFKNPLKQYLEVEGLVSAENCTTDDNTILLLDSLNGTLNYTLKVDKLIIYASGNRLLTFSAIHP